MSLSSLLRTTGTDRAANGLDTEPNLQTSEHDHPNHEDTLANGLDNEPNLQTSDRIKDFGLFMENVCEH